MSYHAGRHFLQIPGPSNVPDRVLRAIDQPTIDHRGPDFAVLGKAVLSGMQRLFQTSHPVVIYPASGTGAWEAALVNTLSPGDTVLMYETGQFATLWQHVAKRIGLVPEFISSNWRHGADPTAIAQRLSADVEHRIKAVCVVHSETSTGACSPIAAVRQAISSTGHPALLLVDVVSSLGSIDYQHEAWGVDVSIASSQKGLMLPAGLSFNALSPKALAASESAGLTRSYWSWAEMLGPNKNGYFPFTPSTNLLYGLREALHMLLEEEGLPQVFARHARLAAATRAAVQAWGLELCCEIPEHYSNVVTAVRMPAGHSEVALRKIILERFNMSLGSGLGKLSDTVFRIGHVGDFNDLSLMGTLAGVEMGLSLAQVPHRAGGVAAAMTVLSQAG